MARSLFRIGLGLAVVVLWAFAGGLSADRAAAGPTEGGIASDDVEYVRFVPFEVGTATGASVVGDFLYVTSWRSFSIYDVSDPLNPLLESTTPFGFKFENENVATNGDILLFSEQTPVNQLHVWSVEDKSNPVEIATLEGAGEHTVTCLFDCTFAWGADTGDIDTTIQQLDPIIDLRDPATPTMVGFWGEDLETNAAHDVTQVAPGRVITASSPMQFVDARHDRVRPRLLAVGPGPKGEYMHSVRWPRRGQDRFVLATTESTVRTRCEEGPMGNDLGSFVVYDASDWKTTRSFQILDKFQLGNGAYVDGSPPANWLGCSPHWFQEHPSFRDGGLVAGGFYDHGTRFLKIDRRGNIQEVGYFLPYGGATSAAYWLDDELVYAIDYSRGIDILRFTGKVR